MTTRVQTLPAGRASHFSSRPLWAAIAVLGVAVIALGASLIHVQTRPVDGHAVFAPSEPDASTADAPATTTTPLPVNTVAPGETIVPAKAATAPSPAATPAKPVATPPAASGPTSRLTPANMEEPVAATAMAPIRQPARAPYVVTASGAVIPSQPVNAPMALPVCAGCGRVEAVTPVQRQGQAQGLGAVTGGVIGAVVGNQIGKGSGRTIATVLGAVGGGVAGNAIEKNRGRVTVYLVQVRMEDGSVRSIEQSSAPAIGSAVFVDGQSLRSADGGRIVSTSGTATNQPTSPQGKVYSTERN